MRVIFSPEARQELLYSVKSDHIYFIAVAHLHRKPNYWVERIEVP
jgi:hypothetical protein